MTQQGEEKPRTLQEITADGSGKCRHGIWPHSRCKAAVCWEEMCMLEDAATCPHGFLLGCPTCTKGAA